MVLVLVLVLVFELVLVLVFELVLVLVFELVLVLADGAGSITKPYSSGGEVLLAN
jgi:hypothetical protein